MVSGDLNLMLQELYAVLSEPRSLAHIFSAKPWQDHEAIEDAWARALNEDPARAGAAR